MAGFAIEGTSPTWIYGNSIVDCKVSGNCIYGVYIGSYARNCKVENVEIYRLTHSGAKGIYLRYGYGNTINNNNIHDFTVAGTGIIVENDTLSTIIGNKVLGLNTANSYGISLSSSYLTSVISNTVRTTTGGAGIYINADYNNIIANYAEGISGISITSGSEYNKIFNNTCRGTSANYDIYDLDGDNMKINNFGIASVSLLPNVRMVSLNIGDAVLKLTPVADPPASPSEGWIYSDTDHKLYYYNGSGWAALN